MSKITPYRPANGVRPSSKVHNEIEEAQPRSRQYCTVTRRTSHIPRPMGSPAHHRPPPASPPPALRPPVIMPRIDAALILHTPRMRPIALTMQLAGHALHLPISTEGMRAAVMRKAIRRQRRAPSMLKRSLAKITRMRARIRLHASIAHTKVRQRSRIMTHLPHMPIVRRQMMVAHNVRREQHTLRSAPWMNHAPVIARQGHRAPPTIARGIGVIAPFSIAPKGGTARATTTKMVLSATQFSAPIPQRSSAATPLATSRTTAIISQRGNGALTPIFGHQAPPPTLLDKLLSPGLPNEDTLLSLMEVADRSVGEELMVYLMKQLDRGPASLADTTLLDQANAALPPEYDRIDQETWHALLQQVIILAVRHIKVFDDRGLRKLEDIQADAALLLELDPDQLAEWEDRFGIHGVAENLIDVDEASMHQTKLLSDDLMSAIKVQLAERASGSFETGDYRDALLYSFEIKIQWAVARHSAIQDKKRKVELTTSFILEMAATNKIAAGRALALIMRHSKLSREKVRRTHPLIPHWHRTEVHKLISAIMEHVPIMVSDTSFRGQLTPLEQSALNRLVFKTNYGDIMQRLSMMSPDRPIEDYIDAIAEADNSGRVLIDIVMQMLDHHEKDKLN